MQRIARSEDERARLAEAARTTRDKRAWLRMRALLLWDEGQTPTEVSHVMGVGRQRLYDWRARYLEQRDPRDLVDSPRPGREPRLSVEQRARLAEILEQGPAEHGYHSHGWTVPLLLQDLESHEGVVISDSTLRRTLHSLGYRWKRPRFGLARKDPERAGKEGGVA